LVFASGSSDKATYPLLDLYPYATTTPIYIAFADYSPIQKEDAAYFEAWIDRMIAAAKAFQGLEQRRRKIRGVAAADGGARGVRAFKIMN
jgi:TolB protein